MALPARGLDLFASLGHDESEAGSDTHAVARYAPGRQIEAGLRLHRRPGVLFDADAAFNLSLPLQPLVRFKGSVRENSTHYYQVDLLHTHSRKLSAKFDILLTNLGFGIL